MTASDSRNLIERARRLGPPYFDPYPVVLASASGCWVTDDQGRRYLDLLAGFSTLNLGHGHPRIVAALKRQAERLALPSRVFFHQPLVELAERLTGLTGLGRMIPLNTGTEAVDTALKLVRRWGYRHKQIPDGRAEVIVCDRNYHGRSLGVISASDSASRRAQFGPFLPGFRIVPFGDAAAFEAAIGPQTAAFLVEPVQAEAGVRVPPPDYLPAIRRICRRHNVLLVFDEIQVSLGRTGRLFCFENWNARPDVLLLGKSLGGGLYPVSAIVGERQAMEVLEPGDHGSTFGGNALACAVAVEALDVLVEERLAERAAELGSYLLDRLRALDSPAIVAVRGLGLMVGLELAPGVRPRGVCERLIDVGLLCHTADERVIRLSPPLIITRDELDVAVERIAGVLAQLEVPAGL